MSATATTLTATTLDRHAPVACPRCAGTGWADPWELADGSPELISCDRCLGAGLDGCPDCDGEGVLAVARPCSCQRASAA